jgi:hypothetical protein
MIIIDKLPLQEQAYWYDLQWQREQYVVSGYVPGLEYRHCAGSTYFEKIKLIEETGLHQLTAQAMRYWLHYSPHHEKYSRDFRFIMEDKFPILKVLDNDRLTHFEDPPCRGDDCAYFGHVMSAAVGAVVHMRWKHSIDRRMPYWTNRDHWLREQYRKGRRP